MTAPAPASVTDDSDSNPMLMKTDTIETRILGDQNSSFPIDVAVVEMGSVVIIVVCDRANCLKSFYKENNEVQRLKLEEVLCPVSVTNLQENQLAVTVPHANKIAIVEVMPHLQLVSTIKTEKSYSGITALTPSTIAASSCDPPGIDILDLSGSVLKDLDIDHDLLKDPSCLATTREGHILVSDSQTRLVLCLNTVGDTVFTFSHTDTLALDIPLGMAVLPSGEVLVSDCGLHCIIQLKSSGQFAKKLLTSEDRISQPHAISVDKHGRLYVCDWFDEKVNVYS